MDIVNVLVAEPLLPRHEKASCAQPLLHAPCCLSKVGPGHQPRRRQSCFDYKIPASLGNAFQFFIESELRILGVRRNHPTPPSTPAVGSQCTRSPQGDCCSAVRPALGNVKQLEDRARLDPLAGSGSPEGPPASCSPAHLPGSDGMGTETGTGQGSSSRTGRHPLSAALDNRCA